MKKLDILAIGVHPDDVELGCAGTVLRQISLGYTVGICDLTMGQLGSRGSAKLRLKEADAAKDILGIEVRENLGMEDGFFVNDEAHKRQIIEVIRRYKPDVVLANAVEDRHPDHGRAAQLTAEACFYSGLVKIETSDNGAPQEPWRPKAVYHYIQDRNIEADFVVDITEFMDRKIESILAYSSQFNVADGDGRKTPISGKEFMEAQRAKHRVYGRPINVDYAEGFTVSRYIGIQDIMKLR